MPVRLQAIRPRKQPAYDLAAFNRAVQVALDDTARAILKDFERTVKTWKRKPEFYLSTRFRVGSRNVEIIVGTDNIIYGYVNDGTRAHIIRPKRSKVLRFQSKYRSKTMPNQTFSRAGGGSGGFVFAQKVNHPGTKARNFDKVITDRHTRRGTLPKNIQRRWDAEFRKAG